MMTTWHIDCKGYIDTDPLMTCPCSILPSTFSPWNGDHILLCSSFLDLLSSFYIPPLVLTPHNPRVLQCLAPNTASIDIYVVGGEPLRENTKLGSIFVYPDIGTTHPALPIKGRAAMEDSVVVKDYEAMH
jgi:hypothetical protein